MLTGLLVFATVVLLIAGIFCLFVHKSIDTAHLCRTTGVDLELTFLGKLINLIFSFYFRITGRHLLPIPMKEWVANINLDAELETLTSDWGAPSPMISADTTPILQQEKKYYEKYSKLLNNPAGMWSPVGRIFLRTTMSSQMKFRKLLFEYAQQRPQILRGTGVDSGNRMLVIVGMHRSGTSLLQNLLALDPKARTTRTWEMMEPMPPPTSVKETKGSNERCINLDDSFDKIDLFCSRWRENFHKVHYFTAAGAEEDAMVLFFLGAYWFHAYYLRDLDPTLIEELKARKNMICRFLHLYLKVMESGYPPESHWILKNPDNCHYLPELLEEFPEANIVMTHRNPVSVVPSWANMMLQCLHVRLYNDWSGLFPKCETMTPSGWGKSCLFQSLDEANDIVAARKELKKKCPEQEKRILDISYSAFVSDPESVIRNIYDHFGYEFTEEFQSEIREYLLANPKGKHGKVSYSLDSYNLTPEFVEEQFKDYINEYSAFF